MTTPTKINEEFREIVAGKKREGKKTKNENGENAFIQF